MVDTQSSERTKELSFARLHHHALKLEGPVKRADNFTSRRKSNRKRSSLHEIVRASTTFLVCWACAKMGLPRSVRKNTFATGTWKTSKRGTRSVAKKCSWWHICAVRLRILDLITVCLISVELTCGAFLAMLPLVFIWIHNAQLSNNWSILWEKEYCRQRYLTVKSEELTLDDVTFGEPYYYNVVARLRSYAIMSSNNVCQQGQDWFVGSSLSPHRLVPSNDHVTNILRRPKQHS
jgi:hypothetical protein